MKFTKRPITPIYERKFRTPENDGLLFHSKHNKLGKTREYRYNNEGYTVRAIAIMHIYPSGVCFLHIGSLCVILHRSDAYEALRSGEWEKSND